jgi:hypothetical protein
MECFDLVSDGEVANKVVTNPPKLRPERRTGQCEECSYGTIVGEFCK